VISASIDTHVEIPGAVRAILEPREKPHRLAVGREVPPAQRQGRGRARPLPLQDECKDNGKFNFQYTTGRILRDDVLGIKTQHETVTFSTSKENYPKQGML
jgi:hypothetical protein